MLFFSRLRAKILRNRCKILDWFHDIFLFYGIVYFIASNIYGESPVSYIACGFIPSLLVVGITANLMEKYGCKECTADRIMNLLAPGWKKFRRCQCERRK